MNTSGTLRHDEAIQCVFDWGKGMTSQSSFNRATRMMGRLVRRIFENRKWFPIDDCYCSEC